jgi:4-amino-4-deoxy-L-arabinose transferase-like glycosyltransferase
VFKEKSDELFFVFWAVFVFIFFSVSVNKLHNYILIAYPPIAIVIGHTLSRMTFVRKSTRVIYSCVAVIEVLGFVYAAFYMKNVPAAVLLGGAFVVFITFFTIVKGDRLEKMLPLVVAKGVAILLMVNLFMAAYEARIRTASALVILEAMFEKSPVYFYKRESEDIVFYANRCISKLRTKEELEKVIQQNDEIVLFAREKDMHDLKGFKTDVVVPFDDISGRKRYLVEIEKSSP